MALDVFKNKTYREWDATRTMNSKMREDAFERPDVAIVVN